jgi:hypothetical protein
MFRYTYVAGQRFISALRATLTPLVPSASHFITHGFTLLFMFAPLSLFHFAFFTPITRGILVFAASISSPPLNIALFH